MKNGEVMTLPCSLVPSLPPVTFAIGGADLDLHPSDYILRWDERTCYSAFTTEENDRLPWVLGQAFL